MKRLVLPLAIMAMLALLGAAVAWDCVRLAADARQPVEITDAELQKHETRLVNLLSGSAKVSPEVQQRITSYQHATSLPNRHQAYESLIVSFRKTMSTAIDPTNPLDRKFMDDIAGAVNRREIAEKPYDQQWAPYQDFLASWRGSVARLFSSQARKDWNQHP